MISIFLYIFLSLKYLFNVYLTSNLLLVTVIDMTLLFWKYFRKVTACYQYCIVVLHGPTVLILLHVQQFFCMRWKCFVILYMFGYFKDEGHFMSFYTDTLCSTNDLVTSSSMDDNHCKSIMCFMSFPLLLFTSVSLNCGISCIPDWDCALDVVLPGKFWTCHVFGHCGAIAVFILTVWSRFLCP